MPNNNGDGYHSIFLCGLEVSDEITPAFKWISDPEREVSRTTFVSVNPITFRKYTGKGAPPDSVHKHLNLPGGACGFLFVHDVSSSQLEASVQCMHQNISLLLRYGGRGFLVVINGPDDADSADSLTAHFEHELAKYHRGFGRRVIQAPLTEVCQRQGLFDSESSTFPLYVPGKHDRDCYNGAGALSNQDFWHLFCEGSITPWGHRDYLRAAFLMLVDPKYQAVGLLEVATLFADKLDAFKQRSSRIQLQPASRTLTVFWLYHVNLTVEAIRNYEHREPQDSDYPRIFHDMPQLADEKLPSAYYSLDMLRSEYADRFWMLPDLRPLVNPLTGTYDSLRQSIEANTMQNEDPERVLRFAFALVQRYLRPGETRLRSWFLKLGFDALQQQTMRLRTMHPCTPPYSVTQTYFYTQLVHAALSQLVNTGQSGLVQDMSYSVFAKHFHIYPSIWQRYYSPKLWDSPLARRAFMPPDLRPLPDTIATSTENSNLSYLVEYLDDRFRKLGLIPELPPFEVLRFHQAIFLEDTQLLKPALSPAEVTTHAHLIRYLYTNVLDPTTTSSSGPDSIIPLARHHLTLLRSSSPLPPGLLTFHLRLALLFHPSLDPAHANPDYNPPPRRGLLGPPPRDERWEEWVRTAEGGWVVCWEGAWRGFFDSRRWEVATTDRKGILGWGRREGWVKGLWWEAELFDFGGGKEGRAGEGWSGGGLGEEASEDEETLVEKEEDDEEERREVLSRDGSVAETWC